MLVLNFRRGLTTSFSAGSLGHTSTADNPLTIIPHAPMPVMSASRILILAGLGGRELVTSEMVIRLARHLVAGAYLEANSITAILSRLQLVLVPFSHPFALSATLRTLAFEWLKPGSEASDICGPMSRRHSQIGPDPDSLVYQFSDESTSPAVRSLKLLKKRLQPHLVIILETGLGDELDLSEPNRTSAGLHCPTSFRTGLSTRLFKFSVPAGSAMSIQSRCLMQNLGEIFEREYLRDGYRSCDFSYAGPQGVRLSNSSTWSPYSKQVHLMELFSDPSSADAIFDSINDFHVSAPKKFDKFAKESNSTFPTGSIQNVMPTLAISLRLTCRVCPLTSKQQLPELWTRILPAFLNLLTALKNSKFTQLPPLSLTQF
ncbi:unnamed protein product [Protopolystoma xenopodis]|uniref:Uncharacterized protein n=1 Tax=Protopolystoma xenopodis TaxID=117903 RepID=A0A3S4ZM12_9PLAT|nr:unnamed protein product [Protopolystoma xenopodis]